MKIDWTLVLAGLFFLCIIAASAVVGGGAVYIVAHFISKFW